MAGSSDGAIIIDTELDSSGFDKGSEKLLGSIKALTGAVDNVGDNMMSAFEQMIPILRDVASNTSGIYAAMTGEGQKAAETAREVASAEQAVAQEAQKMGSAASESGEAVTTLKQEAEAVQAAANGAGGSLEAGLSGASASAGRLQGQLAAVNRQIAEMETKISEQEAAKLPYVEQAEELRAKIKAAEAEVANYRQAWINGTPGADVDQAASQARVDELRLAYEAVVAQIDKMDAALGKSDAKLEQLKAKADALAQRMKEASEASEKLKGGNASSAEGGDAEEPGQAAAEKMPENIAETIKWLNKCKNLLPGTTGLLGQLSRAFKSAAGAALNFVKSALSKLKAGLQAVGTAALNCAKRLAKMAFTKMASGIKNAAGRLVSFAKQSRKTSSMAKELTKTMTSLKTMLVSRLKRTFISYLMNEIKSSVDGLAQYSNAFDQAISGMRNATSELGANLAVSFSNLVNAVAPAITTIISYLSQAASYLSAFFGMLGGKSSVTVAKKQTDSYAESLSDATDSANALNKANHALGIDELNVVSQDSDSSSSGKTGTDIYEEVPIDQLLPEDVSNWFGSIKAAFQNGDWEGIGSALTTGLNTAISSVNTWIGATVAPKVTEWSGRIAQLLNGAVSGLDWAGVGILFGTGLNIVAATVDTFLTTFDFQNLGSGIASAVNGLFDTVDWRGLGATFGHHWTALIDTVYGFVTATDWESVGSDIAGLINGWFNGVDWLTLGAAVGIGISGVISTIHTVINETDWATVGGKLGASVSSLFGNIDWVGLADMIVDGFISAITFLDNAIENFDWQQLGHKVATVPFDIIKTIDWSGLASAIFEGIGAALGGMVGFVWGLMKGLWETISEAWSSVVGWWKETAFEDGKFTILGLLDGILDALANIGKWIVDNIFWPFIKGFAAAFGIHSPSTVMAEQGNFLVEGLLEGIKGVWDSITGYFSTALTELKTAIGEKWDAMKTAASEKWSSIKNAVSTQFTELKTKLSTTANQIKNTISGKWTEVKTTASTKWTDIKQTVSEKWEGLKTALKETDWKEIGGNLVAGVKQGILNAWDAFKTFVTNKFASIIDSVKGVFGIHSPSKVFAEIGEYLDEGLVVGVKAGEKSMLRSVKEMAGNVTRTMSDIDPEIEIAGNATLTGINNAAAALSGIADKFAAIAKVLTDMGGLQVPAVATGAVVPYQARVSSAAGGYAAENLGAVIAGGNAEVTATLRELVQDVIQAIRDNTPQFRIGDEQVMRSYDRANESRGIRVNQGAFANAY